MGARKFRPDVSAPADANGAVAYHTKWMGGPTLAEVRNCPTPFGPRIVYASDHPDTYFSIPARCEYRKRTWHGYLYVEDGNWYFSCAQEFPHND